jgi:hypothetical protein
MPTNHNRKTKMKIKAVRHAPNFAGLVRDLLDLDPAALASLGANAGFPKHAPEAGLHELMRRVLEQSLGLLWARGNPTLRLRTDTCAKGRINPDSRAVNRSSPS